MNIAVVYNTKGGSTKKIAAAIAQAAGVDAVQAAPDLKIENIDLLFIGDGVYGGNVSREMQEFVEGLGPQAVKKAAVFGTYGGGESGMNQLKKQLAGKGIELCAASFGCKGKAWWFFNRGRPNDEDISRAKEFAKQAVKSCGG